MGLITGSYDAKGGDDNMAAWSALKADPTRVRAQMEADRKANTEARENRRHEAAMDKVGAKLAKEMGPVRLIQPENDPVRGAFNQAMKKQRLRKVN